MPNAVNISFENGPSNDPDDAYWEDVTKIMELSLDMALTVRAAKLARRRGRDVFPEMVDVCLQAERLKEAVSAFLDEEEISGGAAASAAFEDASGHDDDDIDDIDDIDDDDDDEDEDDDEDDDEDEDEDDDDDGDDDDDDDEACRYSGYVGGGAAPGGFPNGIDWDAEVVV